jgi:hypothetical protein
VRFRLASAVLASAALLGSALAPSGAVAAAKPRPAGKVPQGYFGADIDPWYLASQGVDVASSIDSAAVNGIETLRFPLYWSKIQPYSSIDQVPTESAASFVTQAGSSAPYDWSALDAFVLRAAKDGIRLLPTVMGAPVWAADTRYSPRTTGTYVRPPRDNSQFATFVASLAKRYGTGGTLWADHSDIATPISTWQIWNEPNLAPSDHSTGFYWPQHGGEKQDVIISGKTKSLSNLYWAPTYVSMLRAVRSALREADPSSKLMLASLTNSGFLDLDLVYKSGGKGLFDSIGANLFTATSTCLYSKACVKGIPTLVNLYRGALKRNKDSGLSMTVTEFSWSAGKDFNFPINDSCSACWLLRTKTGQATNIQSAVDEMIKARVPARVTGAYWYTWASNYQPDIVAGQPQWSVWDYAGLNRVSGSGLVAMPVLGSYKSKLMSAEGCTAKSSALICSR